MSRMGSEPDREEQAGAEHETAAAESAAPRPTVRGVDVIRDAVRTMPQTPGVYRMIDSKGGVLYVGKARNLKKRVTSYTNLGRQPVRLLRMIAQTASMEIVVTHTEAEALLLEANLIKRFKPRYNIILRDDKSYPYILLRGDHPWPQLVKHRGAQGKAGRYFGPFASAGAVNRTLNALQRAFPLRTCSDANFENRTRPCLQYQIKRCTAPCVNYIGRDDYDELADQAGAFLAGKSQAVQRTLAQQMQEASDRMEFERAAVLRDRIRALTQVQSHQDINLASVGDADVIGAAQEGDATCVQVFFFRGGRNYGNRSFFPTHTRGEPLPEVLSAFLSQFYEGKQPPPLVLVSETPEGEALIASALSLVADRKVTLTTPQRGDKKKLVDHAVTNAREALARRLSESATQRRLLDAVAEAFGLEGAPQRIEVYDNSHISGTDAVGGMIVAGPDGFMKNAYRKFNIRKGRDGDLAPGDDYGMMRQVLSRRFGRLLKEDPDRERGQWPDLVLIDGGAGQLSSAEETLADLGIEGVPLVAIAKGPDRDAGREKFFMPGRPTFMLRPGDPVLYFLQRLRDEAHRFAIGTHRARRSKGITRSDLDEIPGIGAKRKRALLHHFGSAKAVREAGLTDLESAEGINKRVARVIYDHFHTGG